MRAVLLGLFILLPLHSDSKVAADPNPLVGSWKLVSYQSTVEGEEPHNYCGKNPRGYLILTPERRIMTVITSNNRKATASGAARRQLLLVVHRRASALLTLWVGCGDGDRAALAVCRDNDAARRVDLTFFLLRDP